MKKVFLLMCALFAVTTMTSIAQESNGGKKIWAKSFLNQQAPPFEVEKWVSDEPDMKGKFVLVEFWATWCGPCRKAIPKLNEIQKQYADKLVIVGITDEPYEQVADWMSPKMEYYSAVDTRAIMKDTYEVTGVPHAVLISPDNVVIWEGFPLNPGFELTDAVVGDLITKYSK